VAQDADGEKAAAAVAFGSALELMSGAAGADRRWRSAPASRIEKTKAGFSRRADPEKPHMRPYPPPLN
jgi:hypothetical protein